MEWGQGSRKTLYSNMSYCFHVKALESHHGNPVLYPLTVTEAWAMKKTWGWRTAVGRRTLRWRRPYIGPKRSLQQAIVQMVKTMKASDLLSRISWFLLSFPAPAEFTDMESLRLESGLAIDFQAHQFLKTATAAEGGSRTQGKHGWNKGSKSTGKD